MCDSSFHVDVENEGCDVSHATYLSVGGFHLEFVMTPHSSYTSQPEMQCAPIGVRSLTLKKGYN